MSWRDRYRQASFRGVPFYVREVESAFGRAQVVHEYPLLDIPSTEDMGRNADEFTVQAYLVGQDYDIERDRLIAACRDVAGPGELVHPYQGSKTVICRGIRVRESSEDGGMCMLSLTFLEAGQPIVPLVVTDGRRAVAAAATAVADEAAASFTGRFSLARMPGFVVEAARAQVAALAGQLNVKGVARNLEAVADFSRQVRKLNAEASDLINSPDQLAAQVQSTIGLVREAFTDSRALLASLFDSNSSTPALAANTPSRRQQRANETAFLELVRQTVIGEQALAELDSDPASYQDALASRDAVVNRLDDEIERAEDDAAVQVLLNLRGQVARALPPAGATLPYLIDYRPPATVPSLVLAQRLYGDASRADEIVARNRIRHPAFVPGGRSLEVLSDG